MMNNQASQQVAEYQDLPQLYELNGGQIQLSPRFQRVYQSSQPKIELHQDFMIIVLLFVAIILLSYVSIQLHPHVHHTTMLMHNTLISSQKTFKKILWVQSDIDFRALGVFDSLTAKHQIDIGRKSGYDVRVVDSLTAYDWLSPEMAELIRKVKHNSKIYIPVIDLLRIALLIEHGGVSVRVGRHIFIEDLTWINALINSQGEVLQQLQNEEAAEYCDTLKSPEVILFYLNRKDYRFYEEKVLIAKPGSLLLREAFEQMVRVLKEGEITYDYLQTIGGYHAFDRYITMQNFLSKIISFKWHFWSKGDFCQTYSVLSIKKSEGRYIKQLTTWIKIRKDFLIDINQFYRINGHTKMVELDLNCFMKQFTDVFRHQFFGKAHKNSIFRKLIESKSNSWLLNPLNKTRNVQFCVISLKPLPIENYKYYIKESIKRLSNQSFQRWKAVYFMSDLNSSEMAVNQFVSVAKIVKASQWQGLNLQRAATKHCGERDIGIILDYDQCFQQINALSIISKQFEHKDVSAAFVTTRVGKNINLPEPNMKYYRSVMHTDKENFFQLAVNLRIVSLLAYRLVPPFDLHDTAGRYYNRQLPFYTLIQLNSVTDECQKSYLLRYFLKSAESKVEIPKYRVYLPSITVRMAAERAINFDLYEYRSKYNAKSWCEGVKMYIYYNKHSLDNYFIYNNGSEFIGFQNRKHLPEQIPRKIHQIWVGNKELPHHRKFLIQNIRKNHPSYKHYLWENQNITRENFPNTYDLIQLIFALGKTSPLSKMAMAADLMRLEILYNHGGVYIDTNYYIFRENALDDWLTFKAMLPGQMIPNYKEERQNGLFAAVKRFQNIGRLLDHRRLSMLNIFARHTSLITGPFYFSQSIYGAEELDQSIFVAPQEHIYPFYDSGVNPCYCIAPYNTSDDEVLFKNNYAYWKNCSQTYPWSFGLDFLQEGGTWKF